MPETYRYSSTRRKNKRSKEKPQPGNTVASIQQNLTVKTISVRFYRIAWWLVIALFISFFISVSISRSLA
jgi:hypothetical protein